MKKQNSPKSTPVENSPNKNPYLDARREWNERYGSYINQAKNWRLTSLISMLISLVAVFLSCLYGSELVLGDVGNGLVFLSCLYGSEPPSSPAAKAAKFLSCLYGSEHSYWRKFHNITFLSCLYGSEPKRGY